MKKIVSILSICSLAMALTSCFVSTSKYDAVVQERDSLRLVASNVTTDFEASLRTINEIETALQTVREAENIIMIESQEGNTNYAVSQIDAIQRTIQQNKEKIAELENQLAQSGSTSKQLSATVNRLKKELDEKDTYINNLRDELNVSKAQVADLTVRVDSLNQNVRDLNENIDNLNTQNAEQQAVIRNQDAELNTVYYFVAPMETLVERGLANKGGLFSKSTASNEIDKSMMVAADKRELKLIALNTTKATILTNHPESSYQITKGDDGMLSLNILNADAFWNTSNYLIISIK
jgi:chromosome segregation ATPase